jgi:hypothetical protein
MSRETAINVLVGLILLSVFGLLVFLAVAPIFLLFSILTPPIERATASFGLPFEVWYFALLCVSALVCAVRCARNHYWPNAFLALATLPMAGAALFVRGQLSDSTWPFVGLMLVVFALPDSRRLTFWQFAFGALSAQDSCSTQASSGKAAWPALSRKFCSCLSLSGSGGMYAVTLMSR